MASEALKRAKAKYRAGNERKPRPCAWCGTTFRSTRKASRFCTLSCYSASCRDKRMPVLHPDAPRHVAPPILDVPRTWTAGACVSCGATFVVRNDPQITTCSEKCQRRVHRKRHRAKHGRSDIHRHRARRYGVEYEPISNRSVFERDDWRCGICGEDVDRSVKAPHPLSPSLDHVVPMSLGGGHTLDNVQCAHFRCNTLKGARAA